MNEVLTKLLDAHVRHQLASWRGERLARTVSDRVSALFRWFEVVKLDDVASPAQISQLIDRYVIELRVSGGITELSGEMSQLVFTSRAATDTRLDQILTAEMYEEFADKVLALEGVRRNLIGLIAQSSTVQTISVRFVAQAVLDLLVLAVPGASRTPPAISALATRLGATLLPGLERLVAKALALHRARMTRDGARQLLEVLDSERLRSVVDELWDRVSPMQLSEVFAFVQAQDIEDFVVLVYEFWLRYRDTEFFRRITREGVDYFFQKYGQTTLLALIDDMGVSEAMVRQTSEQLLRPFVEHAAVSGELERAIRKRLEDFYRSEAAEAALRH